MSKRKDDSAWHEGLTDKQRRFVEEYCVDWNATGAARRAGYSESTAHAIGWENLRKPEIEKAIKQRLSELAMGPDEVVARLSAMARADLGDFMAFRQDGSAPAVSMTGDSPTYLVKKYRRVTTSEKGGNGAITEREEIELHDPKDALDKLARAHGIYKDGLAITQVNLGGDDLTDEAKASLVEEYFRIRG